MDRFRTAKQKIRSEEEAAQERYRSNLLRAISHDLRTPLSAIMGSAEMIRGMSQENDPRYDLAAGDLSGRRLAAFAGGKYSQPDAHSGRSSEPASGKEAPRKSSLPRSITSLNERRSARSRFSIPDEVLMIPMDGKLIQQVLINLLDNALKHTRPQEEITLNAAAGTERSSLHRSG